MTKETLPIPEPVTEVKKEPPRQERFKVVMQLNGTEYVADGNTIELAIKKLKIPFYKTKAIINVFDGDRTAEMVIYRTAKLRKLFGDKVTLEVVSRNLLNRLC